MSKKRLKRVRRSLSRAWSKFKAKPIPKNWRRFSRAMIRSASM